MKDLVFSVTDLLGRPGAYREVSGTTHLGLETVGSWVEGPVEVRARLEAVPHGVLVRGAAAFTAHLSCNRCTVEWDQPMEAELVHLLTDRPDEDGYRIASDGTIDLEPLVRDEVATALPLVPLCREDCAGLCPVCGTDLNTDPCAGHGEPAASPFAALKRLLDS